MTKEMSGHGDVTTKALLEQVTIILSSYSISSVTSFAMEKSVMARGGLAVSSMQQDMTCWRWNQVFLRLCDPFFMPRFHHKSYFVFCRQGRWRWYLESQASQAGRCYWRDHGGFAHGLPDQDQPGLLDRDDARCQWSFWPRSRKRSRNVLPAFSLRQQPKQRPRRRQRSSCQNILR